MLQWHKQRIVHSISRANHVQTPGQTWTSPPELALHRWYHCGTSSFGLALVPKLSISCVACPTSSSVFLLPAIISARVPWNLSASVLVLLPLLLSLELIHSPESEPSDTRPLLLIASQCVVAKSSRSRDNREVGVLRKCGGGKDSRPRNNLNWLWHTWCYGFRAVSVYTYVWHPKKEVCLEKQTFYSASRK
jgi:hypothetical protein